MQGALKIVGGASRRALGRAFGRALSGAAIAAIAGLVPAAEAVAEQAEPGAPVFHRTEGGTEGRATGGAEERDMVALIADRIEYDEVTGVLRASGDVQIFYRGQTLTTDEIVYDSAADRVTATGAVTLRTDRGETVFADAAALDSDLRNGLVTGARSVIAGEGKIAAVEGRRIDGRYNVLEKAVFSPCEVCAARPTPLWRIRAERILHDQEAGEIHYEDAWFDVLGAPIGFLPYFRHPSPEVERATGFLAPRIQRDRGYGLAAKIPYYFVLDETADFTITPFLMTSDGVILETEIRKRFERGYLNLEIFAGVTDYDNDGRGARARAAAFGEARYQIDDNLQAGLDLAVAADDPFLRRYDYTERDRLTSEAFLRSYDGANRYSGSVFFLQSLRNNEPQDAIPIGLPELSFRHVVATPALGGGELGLDFDAIGLIRDDGRDVGRVSLGADWSRQAILDNGLVLRGFAEGQADFYRIGDDPAFDDDAARFSPLIGAETRMPFIRAEAGGAAHVVEPIVQFVYAPEVTQGDIPNEDSVIVEFDEMNLFETDRFAGFDRRETGAWATVGGRYEYISDGFGLRAAGGRVFRIENDRVFSLASGLNSDDTDYVAAASFTYEDWLDFGVRWRFDEDFNAQRAEAGGQVDYGPASVYGYYLFVAADPAQAALINRQEIALGGALELDRNWTVGGEFRRDMIADRFVNAGGVLTYEDECAGLDLYLERRFTESLNAPRGTSVGFRVRLFGAGSNDPSKASGACAYAAE